MKYRTLKSSELREGMIVNCHGMRCLIDQPIHSREVREYGQTHVFWTAARVLNRAEVSNAAVPYSFTRPAAQWIDGQGWTVPEHTDADHRWTIQGNDNARWSVEAE
jgi:hypothetical protein